MVPSRLLPSRLCDFLHRLRHAPRDGRAPRASLPPSDDGRRGEGGASDDPTESENPCSNSAMTSCAAVRVGGVWDEGILPAYYEEDDYRDLDAVRIGGNGAT